MADKLNFNDVVDEKCRCGHLKSEHTDLHPVYAKGKGACKKCECERFTWVSFVMKDGTTQ